jgi:hypothetical protein
LSTFQIKCTGSTGIVAENPDQLTCDARDGCNRVLAGKIFVLTIEFPTKEKNLCFCSKECYEAFHQWMDEKAMQHPALIGIIDGGIPDDF